MSAKSVRRRQTSGKACFACCHLKRQPNAKRKLIHLIAPRSTLTRDANVTVLPVVDPFALPKSLHQGQRYTILCSVSKGDLPLEIKWYKDGRQIKVPDFPGINVIHVSQFSSNLVFESLRPEHRGNYSCEASNGAGSVSYNSSMTVHGKHLRLYNSLRRHMCCGETQ